MSTKSEALELADAEYQTKREHLKQLAKIDADITQLQESIEVKTEEKREAFAAVLSGGWKAEELRRFNITAPPRRRPRKTDDQEHPTPQPEL